MGEEAVKSSRGPEADRQTGRTTRQPGSSTAARQPDRQPDSQTGDGSLVTCPPGLRKRLVVEPGWLMFPCQTHDGLSLSPDPGALPLEPCPRPLAPAR